VIEAKRFPSILMTPRIKPAHSVILSNGHNHFFWDYADGDARPILDLPTQTDLETLRLCDSGWWLGAWRAPHGSLATFEFLQSLTHV
jgi:hypothetical protein